MSSSELKVLLEKFLDDSASLPEVAALRLLLQDAQHADLVKEWIEAVLTEERYTAYSDFDTSTMSDEVWAATVKQEAPLARRVPFLRRWWAAASILFVIAGSVAVVMLSDRHAPIVKAESILPGRSGALLTLADGSQVLLDTIQNGVVALQGGVTAKVVNGTLQYKGNGDEVLYNTLSTPNGRQFQIRLPDGTQVWLNAASSLKYPTAFTGKERKVEVRGEAYFEVAKYANMPFRVHVNDRAEVTVLGTHFNVNTYENEGMVRTTLLEGSISVALAPAEITPSDEHIATGRDPLVGRDEQAVKGTEKVILKPGQQAQINNTRGEQQIKVFNDADIDKVIAWKNDLFYFERTAFPEIMRQLERWYDIQVIYEKEVPDIEFEGKMTKDVPLSDLLIMLERYDIHFRMEGRKLIILSAGK